MEFDLAGERAVHDADRFRLDGEVDMSDRAGLAQQFDGIQLELASDVGHRTTLPAP
jgi:hypothetical protein